MDKKLRNCGCGCLPERKPSKNVKKPEKTKAKPQKKA